MIPTLHINIDYNEDSPSDSYKGVTVDSIDKTISMRFCSGDVTKDYTRASIVVGLLQEAECVEFVMLSSSCDNFVMDNSEKYAWDDSEQIVYAELR